MTYWLYNVVTNTTDMDSDLDRLIARAAAADFYGYVYQGDMYPARYNGQPDLSTYRSRPVAYLF